MAEQATIKYVGREIDEVRRGMNIPAVFVPTGSYVDTPIYTQGLPEDTHFDALDISDDEFIDEITAKSIYATNVRGWGRLYGLLPLASTPIKLAYFERAVMLSIQAQRAGEPIPTVTVDIENADDKLWWLQMAPNFVSSGFYITVGEDEFGADVQEAEEHTGD